MNVLASFRNSFSRSSEGLITPRASGEPNKPTVLSVQPSIPEHNPPPGLHAVSDVNVPSSQRDVALEPAALSGSAVTSGHADSPPVCPTTIPDSATTPIAVFRRWSIVRVISKVSVKEVPTKTVSITSPRAHKLSASERRAQQNAQVVRTLIIGPENASVSRGRTGVSKGDLIKTKTALLKPQEANKVIAKLRALPPADAPATSAPIHAVCLPFTDAEAEERQFRRLKAAPSAEGEQIRTRDIFAQVSLPSVSSATLDSVGETFKDLSLISLITTPDFGLGQPGDGEGILAGALPTAETVISGVVQITPQLMSLGYATGRAIVPNHTGVYPPTDRMSVLTYWWGLELVLPEPSMAYLNQVQSISHSMMNFLSALALVYGGIREILPFVRYISQFMEWEFSAIKAQDKGQGVVCAATWIMPAAMVPRPWDFPARPTNVPVPTAPNAENPDATVPTVPDGVNESVPTSSMPAGTAPSVPDGKEPAPPALPAAPVPSVLSNPSASDPEKLLPPSHSQGPATISPIALFPGAITAQAKAVTLAA